MNKNPKASYKDNKLPWGLGISQFIYLILSIFGTIFFLWGFFVTLEMKHNFLGLGVAVIIFWILFYGTYKIKSWVVTPILVFSTFNLFYGMLGILSFHPANYIELIKKAVSISMTIFFLFQLYIFSRSETKEFFKHKGTTLIS